MIFKLITGCRAVQSSLISYVLIFLVLLSGCSSGRNAMMIASIPPLPIEETLSVEQKPIAQQVSFADAIASYQSLLQLPGENPFRAQALQRLGDLYLNQGEQKELENEQYSSEADYRQAIQFYQRLINQYPDYQDIGLVYYQLARAYDKVGEVDDSLTALNRVVEYDLGQKTLAEAYFRRAESLFVYGQFRDSLPAYEVVVGMGEGSGFYEQARLKYSWNLFKVDRFDDALISFYSLLELKFKGIQFSDLDFQPKNMSKADQELLRDALRGMTLIFALKGDYQAMHDFGERYSHADYNHLVYEAVAKIYRDEGRFYDEAKVLSAFIDAYPDTAKAAYFQYRLVEIYTSAADAPSLLLAKQNLINNYWLNEARWLLLSDLLRTTLISQLSIYVKSLAEYFHARYQKNSRLVDYEAARDWYQLYIERFHDHADVVEQHFLLAELYNQHGRYQLAAETYEQVAYSYPLHNRSSEAAYAVVLAYDVLAKQPAQESGSDWMALKYQSAIKFVSSFSTDPRRVPLLIALANENYALGSYDQARLASYMLIDSSLPLADKDHYSIQMLLGHIAYQEEDFLLAEKEFSYALDLAKRGVGKQQEVEDWLASSVYKQAEGLLARGKNRQAISNYLVIASLAPRSKIAVQAQYDAATELIKLKDWAEAVRVLAAFQMRYPKHKLQAEVPHKLAFAYMEMGDDIKAAEAFALIAKRSADIKEQREAYLQSAMLLEKGGQDRRAGAAYKKYIYAYPVPVALAFRAKLALAGVYQRSGQLAKRDYWYKGIVSSAATAELKEDAEVQFSAAGASFHLAEVKYQDFVAVKLVEPIKKNMALKRSRMQAAMAAYEKTAEYGFVEYVTAATQRIGSIYFELAEALLNSERPTSLNEDELEQYELMLEEQAYPFEEKSIEILESNVLRIEDGLFDRWIDDSIQLLGQLLPVQYNKPEQSEAVIHVLH